MVEAVDYLAAAVEALHTLVLYQLGGRGPAAVEGVEGAVQIEHPAMPVAVVGVPQAQLRATAEEALVDVAEARRAAVGVVGILEVEETAAALEAGSHPQGPDVAGGDQDVDPVAAVADRLDVGLIEKIEGAQIAGGLLEHPGIVGISAPEEELALDYLGPGGGVETVGDLVEEPILAGLVGVEDVLGANEDLTDHRTVLEQYLVARNRPSLRVGRTQPARTVLNPAGGGPAVHRRDLRGHARDQAVRAGGLRRCDEHRRKEGEGDREE